MKPQRLLSILLFLSLLCSGVAAAQSEYRPSKFVYDISSADSDQLHHLLDRAGLLQIMYGNDPFEASIVLVVHEGAIPLFASAKGGHKHLIQRAESLTAGEVIEFRLCSASARLQGFDAADFPEFVAAMWNLRCLCWECNEARSDEIPPMVIDWDSNPPRELCATAVIVAIRNVDGPTDDIEKILVRAA